MLNGSVAVRLNRTAEDADKTRTGIETGVAGENPAGAIFFGEGSMADELRAAAERYMKPGPMEQHMRDVRLLADWAVQQLTAPQDVEAELQGICMTLADELWRGGIINRNYALGKAGGPVGVDRRALIDRLELSLV